MKNKILGVSSLEKKPNYDTKISELEEKLTDHNHDKYIYIYIYIYINNIRANTNKKLHRFQTVLRQVILSSMVIY